MVKPSRPTVKTLTINRSRDIVVDKLLRQCEQGNHSKCTGWAVLKKENSPINANYFIKCTCACHKKGSPTKKQAHHRRIVKPTKKLTRKRIGKRKLKRARRR